MKLLVDEYPHTQYECPFMRREYAGGLTNRAVCGINTSIGDECNLTENGCNCLLKVKGVSDNGSSEDK